MPKTVMVVEDDADIRLVLRTFLEDEGYRVLEAPTGESALTQSVEESPDVVLVDLRLPGIHGLDVVRSMRATSHVPIIVVTAQTDSHDVVAGLEAGADDYVTKPFVAKELSARIRAQLRRIAPPEGEQDGPEVLSCGPITVRPDTAEAAKDGEPLVLSRTEFRVLQELVLARGRVLSRDDLLRRVWGYGNAGDGRVVDNLVYRLRAKIEVDPADPAHLVTVRGFGYRLKP
ncbi:MAG: response regulator transcription factor [Actinomycetota bacterium]|nr:MAG: response regulator transcription factor [Actinomycetota bacterium]